MFEAEHRTGLHQLIANKGMIFHVPLLLLRTAVLTFVFANLSQSVFFFNFAK